MRKIASLGLVAAAVLSLAACETYGHGPGGPYAYGYVDGYYDDAYGPMYDGYWGPDDAFYYRTSATGDYVRDSGGHVRHDAAPGFHTFHGRAGHAPGGGGPPHM